MDVITNALSALPFDWQTFAKAAAILAVGSILLGAVGNFVFKKRSSLNQSISSAIGIMFIYAVTVVIHSADSALQQWTVPLPFVTIEQTQMVLFDFRGAHYAVLCTQVLSMIILAFIANLFESILPKGKHFISWLFFRCLSIVFAMIGHWIVSFLFTTYLPEGLVIYSPTILLALLVLLLLVGALKLVVGAVLATVNPLIGAFYTFFFSTIVGKALSKAVLTTAILSAAVYALNYIGCTIISIASTALIAYIPFAIVLLVIWYVVSKIFH